jgi:hypothetical protein
MERAVADVAARSTGSDPVLAKPRPYTTSMKPFMHMAIAIALLTPCGCPMDDDDDASADDGADTLASSDDAGPLPSTTGEPESTTGEPESTWEPESTGEPESSTGSSAPSFSVSGVVTRLASAPIAEGNDGIGTLYIGAFAACSQGEAPIGVFAMPEADFSSEDHEVPWQIDGLPAGPVYFGLFLDDDGDAELPSPLPGPGDPTYAEDVCDGLLSCIEIEILEADVTDAALVLDATHTRC